MLLNIFKPVNPIVCKCVFVLFDCLVSDLIDRAKVDPVSLDDPQVRWQHLESHRVQRAAKTLLQNPQDLQGPYFLVIFTQHALRLSGDVFFLSNTRVKHLLCHHSGSCITLSPRFHL